MKRFIAAALVSIGIAGPIAAHAANVSIVYFDADQVGTDVMQEALNFLGPGLSVTVAPSASAFQTDISSNSYNIGILLLNSTSDSSYSGAISALSTFVSNGGKAIFSDMSGNASSESTFGVNQLSTGPGTTNYSSFSLLNNGIQSYLPSSIAVSNPGYTLYALGAFSALSGHTIEGLASGASQSTSPIVEGLSASGYTTADTFWNGFADGAVSGTNGVQLYENEIDVLAGLTPQPVPLPATAWLMLIGLGFFGVMARSRKAAQA